MSINIARGYRAYPHCRLFALEYENYQPRKHTSRKHWVDTGLQELRVLSSFLASIDREPVSKPSLLNLVLDRCRELW
jgi:hypothetical protein